MFSLCGLFVLLCFSWQIKHEEVNKSSKVAQEVSGRSRAKIIENGL